MSGSYGSDELIQIVVDALTDETYLALDMLSTYEVMSIRGDGVREL